MTSTTIISKAFQVFHLPFDRYSFSEDMHNCQFQGEGLHFPESKTPRGNKGQKYIPKAIALVIIQG